MKDADYIEDWVDGLKSRLRIDDTPTSTPCSVTKKTTMPSKGKLPSSLMSEFETTRAAPRSLARLRKLAPTATLLLFTPVMVPAGYQDALRQRAASKSDARANRAGGEQSARLTADPFELLGKTLSKQHSRVRHVPYVPSVGFTETHEAFLMQADAVIVVTCPPESNANLEMTLAKEVEFVGNVAHALEEAEHDVPMVNFNFGNDDWQNEVPSYGHVWAGEVYDAASVTNVIKLLFGSRK